MALDLYDSIFQDFSTATAEDWKNKIIKDLKGEPFEKLIWHSKEGIEVLPFYTKAAVEGKVLQIPKRTTNGWQILERIKVENTNIANAAALAALRNGAQVIVFDLQHKAYTQEEIAILLLNIMTDIAPVQFENYTAENKTILEDAYKDGCPNIIHVPPLDTLTEELVNALQQGTSQHTGTLYFHFYIGKNYFFEIARLRAFRWLWKQVDELRQIKTNIIIQGETDIKSLNQENENNNILSNTTEAMSAILGGCDQLLINSHDMLKGETSFGKRIARNVQHILHYESYFSDIQDAAKGSYYLEYLTYNLAKNAWEKFRALAKY